jgi:hypothetical protein
MMLGTTDLLREGQRVIRREAMFLHISGNLGFALLILFLLFLGDFLRALYFLGGVDSLPRPWARCVGSLARILHEG